MRKFPFDFNSTLPRDQYFPLGKRDPSLGRERNAR